MKISYNYETVKKFASMIFSHDFQHYSYLFKFRNFEEPNLTEDMKDAFLQKLNVSNPEGVPSFNDFWVWVQNNYGDDLAKQYAEANFSDRATAHKHLFAMIGDKKHADWTHIQARVYRKWCSIVTEAQCTYAVLRGIDKLNKNWSVLSSPKLDGCGIDLAVVTEDVVVPIQIKKDTNSKFASHKDNNAPNFSRVKLGNNSHRIFTRTIRHFQQTPVDLMIVKYALADKQTKKLPYDYLVESDNNFVFFDGEKIVSRLEQALAKSNIQQLL